MASGARPAAAPPGRFPPALRRRLGTAWLALVAERLAGAFWLPAAALALALALALSGFLPLLPFWLHAACLAGIGAGLALLLVRSLRAFRVPDRAAAIRRLDGASPLRPASVLDDRLALGRGDPVAERHWARHRQRAAAAAAALPVAAPDPQLARRDPWALRLAAPLLLLAAGLAGWGAWQERLLAAGRPQWVAAVPLTVSLEAWAEPPAYTGAAPRYLTGATDAVIPLPEGTRLQAWVHGATTAPVVRFRDAGGGPGMREFAPADGQAWQLPAFSVPAGPVRVAVGGETLTEWEFRLLPDAPPWIEFRSPPAVTGSGAVTFAYGIGDDHGAVRAWAGIRLAGKTAGEGLELPLPLPPAEQVRRPEGGEEFVIRDLLAHPWAGAEVDLTLFVEDDPGRVGASAPVRFRLPAPSFTDPMAKAFVEQRRELVLADDGDGLEYTRALLAAAIRHPAGYFDDPVPFLAARIAAAGLADPSGAPSAARRSEAAELLWRAARRLDAGKLPDALAALRARVEALEAALREGGKDQAALSSLLAELRQAVRDYLAAMAESLAAAGAPPPGGEGQRIDPENLDAWLQSIGDAARIGAEDEARRQLAQLRALLENLQALPGGGGAGGGAARRELGALIRSQTELAEDTLRLGRETGSGGEGAEDGSAPSLAAGQAALRRRLETFRHRVAGAPAGGAADAPNGEPGGWPAPDAAGGAFGRRLDRAGEFMGQAVDALGAADAPGALAAQREVLEALRAAARRLRGPGESGTGGVGARPGGPSGPGYGALWGSPFGDVGLPDGQEWRQARELFDRIRGKASERSRPEAERDYYRRLIDRF